MDVQSTSRQRSSRKQVYGTIIRTVGWQEKGLILTEDNTKVMIFRRNNRQIINRQVLGWKQLQQPKLVEGQIADRRNGRINSSLLYFLKTSLCVDCELSTTCVLKPEEKLVKR